MRCLMCCVPVLRVQLYNQPIYIIRTEYFWWDLCPYKICLFFEFVPSSLQRVWVAAVIQGIVVYLLAML